LRGEGAGHLFYSLEVRDMAGNRLQIERQPLERPEPESVGAKAAEGKKEIWIEDF
jgi:hypothetical protein